MVITGNEKAFAAGADIKQMANASVVEMLKSDFIPTFDRIRGHQKTVIAAVSGWALGGGCELAMSCDMIVASEKCQIWTAGNQFGHHPWGWRHTTSDPCCWQGHRHGNGAQ